MNKQISFKEAVTILILMLVMLGWGVIGFGMSDPGLDCHRLAHLLAADPRL